jgi:hypothetical protein
MEELQVGESPTRCYWNQYAISVILDLALLSFVETPPKLETKADSGTSPYPYMADWGLILGKLSLNGSFPVVCVSSLLT